MNISTTIWIGLGISLVVLIIKERREVASYKKESKEDDPQRDGSKNK
jgi:hypothetical protein